MQELLYTSVPRGLKPGSRGFCTVLSTQGMVAPLAAALEGLSGYRPVFPLGHERVAENPVVYSHLKLQVAGKSWYVLSRIADYGLDYSQRTNKLAHHLVLDKSELPAAGPASLLRASGIMRESWEGEPKIVPPKPISRQPPTPSGVCQAWKEMTGDAGWAGVLAESFLKDPNRPVILLFEPGQDLRPLIDESLSLLPAERRWDVTFNTYFTGSSQGITCLWRGIVVGSKEATESLRFVNALRIDVTSTDIGRAEGGDLVEAARKGVRPSARPTLPPTKIASREQPEPQVVVMDNSDEPTVSRTTYENAETEHRTAPVASHDHSKEPPRLTPSVFKFANAPRISDAGDRTGRKSSVRKHRLRNVTIAVVVLVVVLATGLGVYLVIQDRMLAQTLTAIDSFIAEGKFDDARTRLDQHPSQATSKEWRAKKEKLDAAVRNEQERKRNFEDVLAQVDHMKGADADSALNRLKSVRESANSEKEKDQIVQREKIWLDKKTENDRKAKLAEVLKQVDDAKAVDAASVLEQLENASKLAKSQEEKSEVAERKKTWLDKKTENDRKAKLAEVLKQVDDSKDADADSVLAQLKSASELAKSPEETNEVAERMKTWQKKQNAVAKAQSEKSKKTDLVQHRAELPPVSDTNEAILYDFAPLHMSEKLKLAWLMPKNQEFKSLEVTNKEDGSLVLRHGQGAAEKERVGILSIRSSKLLFQWDKNATPPLRTHVFEKSRFCVLELREGAKPAFRFFFFPTTKHQTQRAFTSSSLKLIEDPKSEASRLLGNATKLGIHLEATDVSLEFNGPRHFEPGSSDAKNIELRSSAFAKEYCQNFVKLTMSVDRKDGGTDLDGKPIGPTAGLSLQIAAEKSEEKDSHEDEDAAEDFRKALDAKCKEHNVESPPFFIFRDLKKPDEARKKINEKFQLAWQKRNGGGKSWKEAYEDTNSALKSCFDKVEAVAKRFDESQQKQNEIKIKSQFLSAEIVYQVASSDGQREQVTLVRFESIPSNSK